MLASFRSLNSSIFWRALSIVCVMMVVSYILFEVLDLDGSNFQPRHPVENTAIVSEAEANVLRPYLTRLEENWTDVFGTLPFDSISWVRPHLTQYPFVPSFHCLRRCGYRIALPRSSVPDPFPA